MSNSVYPGHEADSGRDDEDRPDYDRGKTPRNVSDVRARMPTILEDSLSRQYSAQRYTRPRSLTFIYRLIP